MSAIPSFRKLVNGFTKYTSRILQSKNLPVSPKYTTLPHSEVCDLNDHLKVLKLKFGLDHFKPPQWLAIQSILYDKRDNYICLPMGYGKSLCYQYPAVYTNTLCVVISPLISLMQDQVKILQNNNIPSCFLASIQENKNIIYEKLYEGYYNLLYITPEFVLSPKGMQLLSLLHAKNAISLFAIDEAHCILHWGKEFRPTYENLSIIRERFPLVPIAALTATATNEERKYIIDNLRLRNPLIIFEDLNKSNLYFMVKEMEEEPYGDIFNIINSTAPKLGIEEGSVIIYCLTKKKCKKIYEILNGMGMNCEIYHSGLTIEQRKLVLNKFMNNETDIVIATSAFGMGINKSDVRIIIHYGTPLNIEGYYQEAGRAGRDGHKALSILLHSPKDPHMHRYLNTVNSKSNDSILYNEKRYNVMKKYITATTCRRHFILSHFELLSSPTNERKDNCCDNCENTNLPKIELYDCSIEADLFLKAIKSLSPRAYGLNMIIGLLTGIKLKRVRDICQNNEYYGAGAFKSQFWWRELAQHLELENYIRISTNFKGSIVYSQVALDERGESWLKNKSMGLDIPIYVEMKNNNK